MIKQIFLFGISFTSIFILCEIFIRTTHLASVSSTEFYDDIGRGRRKNLQYLYFNEGFGAGKFNEFRYIGDAYPPERSENTVRIALIGDSFIESFQIFERDYFGKIAEDHLEDKYQTKQFEFLNFGRSGFDIADIYAYQKTLIEKFNPDFILYMLSNEDLEPLYSDPLRPKTIIKNDSLIISFNFNPQEIEVFEKTKFLTQNSTIFNMLNNGKKKTKTTPFNAIILDKIYFWFNPESECTISHSKHQKTEYQINSVTKKIIESLDTNKIIIVNRDLEEMPREFQKLCSNNGLKYFDLSTTLNSMKEHGIDPNEWKVTKKSGHWNQKAHQILGKEIAMKIVEMMENE